VATPIGNLEDMTPRAVRILGEVDIIAAEDTRHSRGLLSHFNIKPKAPLVSCHKFNEARRGEFFLSQLNEGKSIALISDAGTPCISDPGHKLVRTVRDAGFDVVAVCGASAAVAALSVSGFDVSRYTFVGFLPRARGDMLECLASVFPGVVIFYESPKRIVTTLRIISDTYPQAWVCVCNDISKKFERVYYGLAEDVLQEITNNPHATKGEYACVVEVEEVPAAIQKENIPSLESLLVDIMVKTDCTPRDAGIALRDTRKELSKKEIYAATLNLKELLR